MENNFTEALACILLIGGSYAIGNFLINGFKNKHEKELPSEFPLALRVIGRLTIGFIVIYSALHYFGIM
jgi:hypothetical protein